MFRGLIPGALQQPDLELLIPGAPTQIPRVLLKKNAATTSTSINTWSAKTITRITRSATQRKDIVSGFIDTSGPTSLTVTGESTRNFSTGGNGSNTASLQNVPVDLPDLAGYSDSDNSDSLDNEEER
mmetsp:Transcript_16825/g.33503  ORF Transcript_16825/g.33503 Transcript_16825/m.33503 type:complete len:127 (-) Transcript_16825:537-917(-)